MRLQKWNGKENCAMPWRLITFCTVKMFSNRSQRRLSREQKDLEISDLLEVYQATQLYFTSSDRDMFIFCWISTESRISTSWDCKKREFSRPSTLKMFLLLYYFARLKRFLVKLLLRGSVRGLGRKQLIRRSQENNNIFNSLCCRLRDLLKVH